MRSPLLVHLGDNCIQTFHLGRYFVGYTVGNHVLQLRVISDRISDDEHPQMKILNMVIPILMQFNSFVLYWRLVGRKMQRGTHRYVTYK